MIVRTLRAHAHLAAMSLRTRSILLFGMWLSPLLLRAQVIVNDDFFRPPTLTVVDVYTGKPSTSRPVLRASESHVRHRDPLLPIIFFDNPGEWALPTRYHTFESAAQTAGYRDTNMMWVQRGEEHSYAKYNELLDVLGERMSRYPSTAIGLRGGYSGEPGESPDVARARSATVRDYLTTIWCIAPERIVIADPEKLSAAPDNLYLQEEARRVTIETESWELIGPVDYTVKGGELHPFDLRLGVWSHAEGAAVDSVVVTVTAGTTVIGYAAVPGSPGMTAYDLRIGWEWNGRGYADEIDGLTIDAYVRTVDGVYRRASPIILARTTTYDVQPLPGDDLVIPFFAHQATELTPYQRRWLREIVETADVGRRQALLHIHAATHSFAKWESLPLTEPLGSAFVRCHRARAHALINPSPRPGAVKRGKPVGGLTLRRVDLTYEPAHYDVNVSPPRIDDCPSPPSRVSVSDLTTERLGAVIDFMNGFLPDDDAVRSDTIVTVMPLGHGQPSIPHRPEERWYERSVTILPGYNGAGE